MKRSTKPESHYRQKTGTLASGVVSGVAALGTMLAPPERISYPHRDYNAALRGDAARIGQDMRTVIARNAASIKEAKK